MPFSKHIARGQQAREHRVILIIVAMHPVAADRLKVGKGRQVLSNHVEMYAVVAVVDRVRFGLPKHDAVFDFIGRGHPEGYQFAAGKGDQLSIRATP